MKKYDHKNIEKKWQDKWEQEKLYEASNDDKKQKFYALIEFPYPSGQGLHAGHVRSNTAMDIISRKRRAEGYNVLYPIGWDAFGLPAENYAIKTGINPMITTAENAKTFERQLRALGFSFDWSRLIDTTDPKYYKWTQWIFLQMYKEGLAYKKKMSINWCPSCLTGLANEEVVDGNCERCGEPVVKKEKDQWMLAITKYADRLYDDLDDTEFQEKIKVQQRNWIGKSEGSKISFDIKDIDEKVEVFTTRPDTIFGATYVVLAPENKIISELKPQITNFEELKAYIKESKKRPEIERTAEGKEKTGIRLEGITAVNPATKEEIPVWVADYCLAEYGTGAVMAVPAHDERDWEFATKHKLPIKEVVVPSRIDEKNPPVQGKKNVERQNVHIIVRDPKTDKVLCMKWKDHPWTAFPMGGVDEGEDVVEASKRELREETGYRDVKFVKVLGGQIRAEYFAAHKDENRIAYTNAVMFDLVSDERDEVSKEERDKHEVVWMDRKDIVYPDIVHAELNDWLERWDAANFACTEKGVLVNSGKFTGCQSDQIKKEITLFVGGEIVTTYKLRDWVFSRQRYWGEPIPLVYCEKCKDWVGVPEDDLPVELPEVEKYQPTETGESPLAGISEWVNTTCPDCGGEAKRETDTMPNWAGSSWYYLRYTDSDNEKQLASKEALEYWTPVDWYNGGMEHTTLHLLYSRFWHKFLYDIGVVPTSEPYKKRTSHGLILASDGNKMSKSKGNVVNPDDIVETFGADTLRVYEMFAAPFEQEFAWNEDGLVGARRFIERVWRLQYKAEDKSSDQNEEDKAIHKVIKKVSSDIEDMKFNTAISALMVAVNELDELETISIAGFTTFVRILAPFIPHVAEELFSKLGNNKSVHLEKWPQYDESKLVEEQVTIAVQVNGKVRGTLVSKPGVEQEEVLKQALGVEKVAKYIGDKKPKKVIYVPDKLINLVV